MGRTAAFDRDDVVRAARALFWERGFDAVGIADLERVTGLGRSSLYHAFQSKRGLFDAAVASYLEEVIAPRLAPLSADDVAPEALDGYLAGLLEAVRSPDGTTATGCLLLTAASTPIGADEAVRATIAEYRRTLRDAVRRGLVAVRAVPGNADAGADLERRTDVVTSLVLAALTLARVDRAEAQRLIGTARELAA